MFRLDAWGCSDSTFVVDRLAQNNKLVWFIRLISMVIVMNVLDGLLTLVWIYTDKAVEANPLMNLLLGIHPVLFIATKLALVCFGALLLVRFYYKRLAQLSVVTAFCVYSAIMLYHASMIYILA